MSHAVSAPRVNAGRAPAASPAGKLLGRSIRRTNCRFCHGSQVERFLDLGEVPLAGGFLREEQIPVEQFYPLQVGFCRTCTLVQVIHVVPREVLFGDYFFFSSVMTTLVEHFAHLADEVRARFAAPGRSLAVEIGCNDGVLLKPLAAQGVRCVGVDPAANVTRSIQADGITVVNDFFGERVAWCILEQHGAADVILTSYSFAHIDDMDDVMRGVTALLTRDGALIVEVYYLPTLLEELQYDMIYHEHCSYYTLLSLERFLARYGMEVFDVAWVPGVRGGTMRFYARRLGGRAEPVSGAVAALRKRERAQRVDVFETYAYFAGRVQAAKEELVGLLERLKDQGKQIIGYGASGRATTMMNVCGIDQRYLDYVVDDTPAKQGCVTPGTHLSIKSWSATEMGPRPDYVLAFVWSFIDEIVRKRAAYLQAGGKLIVPLPRVRVIPE